MKPPRHDHEPDNPPGDRQVSRAAMIPAMDPLRDRSASRTRARPAHSADRNQQPRSLVESLLHDKAAGEQVDWPEHLLHRIDVSGETNATQPANVIKIESEPISRAD